MSPIQKRVFDLILAWCQQGRRAFSYQEIQDELGTEKRQTIRAVRELEGQGRIKVDVGRGRGVVNTYEMVK